MMDNEADALMSGKSSTSQTSRSQMAIAQMTWELTNNIQSIGAVEELYKFNAKQQAEMAAAKPWEKE